MYIIFPCFVNPQTKAPVFTKTRFSQDEFFEEARKAGLDTHLDQLVEQNRLDYNDPDVQDMYSAILITLERLKSALKQKERRFDGTFIGVGSYHDGTKLKPADEFDFMYRLDGSRLCDHYSVQRITSRQLSWSTSIRDFSHGRLQLCQEKPDVWYDCTDQSNKSPPPAMPNARQTYAPNPNNETPGPKLSSRVLVNKFRVLVDQSMKNIKLPPGLIHGGWAAPAFGGTDRNGPAVTLLLQWSSDKLKTLCISIDIIICFSVPDTIRMMVAGQLPKSFTGKAIDEQLVLITGHKDEEWVTTPLRNTIG